jgi:hypothetical protein
MKRNVTVLLVAIFAVASVFAGLAFYNNVHVALQWDPSHGSTRTYAGPISWLDWSAVDFSAVTTFVPFFGLAMITVGFLRTLKAGQSKDVSEHFPFHRRYDSITVALGLIGTVWGLIMIGYYDPDTVTMKDLVLCLRTALYSTLIALIWVFLIVYPLRPAIQWWHRQVTGARAASEGGLLAQLAEFGASASNAGQSIRQAGEDFAGAGREVSSARGELDALGRTLAEVKRRLGVDAHEAIRTACAELGATCNRINDALLALRVESEAMQKVTQEQHAFLQKALAELDEERRMRQEAEALLGGVRKVIEGARAEAEQARSEQAAAEVKAAKADAARARAESWLGRMKALLGVGR